MCYLACFYGYKHSTKSVNNRLAKTLTETETETEQRTRISHGFFDNSVNTLLSAKTPTDMETETYAETACQACAFRQFGKKYSLC